MKYNLLFIASGVADVAHSTRLVRLLHSPFCCSKLVAENVDD